MADIRQATVLNRPKRLITYGTRLSAYLVIIVAGVVSFFPFFWMVSTSLKGMGDIFILPTKWLPSPVDWRNYLEIWTATPAPFIRYVLNNVVVSVTIVVGQLLFSSLAAFAFARLEFPGRDLLFVGYLAMLMIPIHVTIIPLFLIFLKLKLIDTTLGIILPGLFSVFGTFLLRQFFLVIPKSLDDAATIDGCGPFGVYWRIILPLAKPGLATLTVFSFIAAWNNFLWPLIIINTEVKKTLPVALANFAGFAITDWPMLMTGSVIAVVPILILFVCTHRFFIKGVVMSGLKG
ncbi:MAG TPA: carbohydrate ABC transporter permease [bacterium]|nr:carbohydrate ABC transporter permease [bacterium]